MVSFTPYRLTPGERVPGNYEWELGWVPMHVWTFWWRFGEEINFSFQESKPGSSIPLPGNKEKQFVGTALQQISVASAWTFRLLTYGKLLEILDEQRVNTSALFNRRQLNTSFYQIFISYTSQCKVSVRSWMIRTWRWRYHSETSCF
jgi:hypothetical protein